MIKYKLICKDCNLSFVSWVASSDEYEKLKKKKFLICHNCDSKEVEKRAMGDHLALFFALPIIGHALAYIIGFQDLMLLGKRWANSPIPGSEPYLIFPLMALIYFALCFPLSKIATVLEKKYSF